jgi:anti-anti-sigma factor
VLLAARYVPAGADREVGGDWYDVVQLPNGQVGMAIGDVAGHGLRAASTMGQLRMGLRAYALEEPSPAKVVNRLDRLVGQLLVPEIVTLVYLVLDLDSGMVRLANAGHPPPLVVGPGGQTSYLEAGLRSPLGCDDPSPVEASFRLDAGSTLLLFTDGLVERRGVSIQEGLERLEVLAADCDQDIEAFCDVILGAMVKGDISDDVALLAIRPLPLAGGLLLHLPAEPRVLAPLRQTLRRWLREIDATPPVANDILLACGEVCANVIQHAYGAKEGLLDINLGLCDGTAEVTVRDQGRWRPSSGIHGGHGLPLIQELMESVEVSSGQTERSCGCNAESPTGTGATHERPRTCRGSSRALCLVRVHGEIDLSNAHEVSSAIGIAMGQEARGLVVDLSDITYLDSAGVALLLRLAERLRARRRQLHLVVPRGSPVRRVLDFTGLPRVIPSRLDWKTRWHNAVVGHPTIPRDRTTSWTSSRVALPVEQCRRLDYLRGVSASGRQPAGAAGGDDQGLGLGPSAAVVEAKLRSPWARPGIVPRPALVDRLLAAAQAPVICVVGPAGYGKTTLLAQWATRKAPRVGWVSIDRRDNEPVVLVRYLATALDRLEPLDPAVFAALAAPGVSVLATVLPRFLAAAGAVTGPVALVLDNLELLWRTGHVWTRSPDWPSGCQPGRRSPLPRGPGQPCRWRCCGPGARWWRSGRPSSP